MKAVNTYIGSPVQRVEDLRFLRGRGQYIDDIKRDGQWPNNPLGAKGAGEGGIIPVGGVVTNAIASALGCFDVQPRDLPLTPPRLWDLIQKSRLSKS